MNSSKTVAIIPARGGSKRIPRKNIKPFCGRPIIAYPIETAQKSNLFDEIIVSTDDKEIANTAKKQGAIIPFYRPQKLADDYTTTIEVIQHAIHWFLDNNYSINNVCCIYPTTPFLRVSDLQKGYGLVKNGNAEFSFPVTTFPSSIFRALKQTPENRLKMFWPKFINTRTQDLPEAYHDAGQFYWGTVSAFLSNTAIVKEKSSPVIIPRHLAQDIDTIEDWNQAEIIYKALISETK